MDPLTHGILGASVAASFSKKEDLRKSVLFGALAAMSPDLDIVIQSKADPLLLLEYHRGFTHSFAFAPFGALICSLIFWFLLRKKFSFAKIYFYSLIAYLTHPLLDACTSYGTQIFWPFSSMRVDWGNIAIIDLLYTVPLMLFLIFAFKLKRPRWAKIAVVFAGVYLSFGFYQKHQVGKELEKLAASRSHSIERKMVSPTPLNLLLWRTIYAFEGNYYVNAIRVSPFSSPKIHEGSSVEAWKGNPNIPSDSTLGKDIQRFAWFSDYWLYQQDPKSLWVSDLRYSPLPQSSEPLWSILVDERKSNEHVQRFNNRSARKEKIRIFFDMILGKEI